MSSPIFEKKMRKYEFSNIFTWLISGHFEHHMNIVGTYAYANGTLMHIFNNFQKDWALHVRYAQPHDSGVYECQLSAHPPIGVLSQLTVIEAIAEITGGSEVRYVQVGSPVQLVCTITDLIEPPAYVFWYHGDRMVNYDPSRQLQVFSESNTPPLLADELLRPTTASELCSGTSGPHDLLLPIIPGEC
ncbi:unnamed protein product, partial [Meganyctiphanes norvegica]